MRRLTCFVPRVGAQAQRCIVKGKVLQPGRRGDTHHTASAIARDYLRYIHREGVGVDGERPRFFDQEGVAIRERFLQQVQPSATLFSWIISPEHGQRLDMDVFTRQLMQRVSTDLRVEFDWIASSHYNTAHPHTHILARGTDKHGKSFEIDNAYLRVGMTNEARELATRELGPQHDFDWEYGQEHSQEVTYEITRELAHEQSRAHAREMMQEWQQTHEYARSKSRSIGTHHDTRQAPLYLATPSRTRHPAPMTHEPDEPRHTRTRDIGHGLGW